jgi:hypothetical protein
MKKMLLFLVAALLAAASAFPDEKPYDVPMMMDNLGWSEIGAYD